MNQDFLKNLPSEIIIDILSRLPVRAIVNCKCACKSWLDLAKTREFIQSHLSRSNPGLAVHQQGRRFAESVIIFEFEDRLDLEHHELHYDAVTEFQINNGYILGSANGLLLLLEYIRPKGLFVCNPITSDYIELHCPPEFAYTYPQIVTFGFGASRATGQIKVVRIFHDCIRDEETHALLRIPRSECHVYTLGRGSWRKMEAVAALEYNCHSIGASLNGNLYWLVYDLKGSPLISCFDLETEVFTTFSPPPPLRRGLVDVFALGDCLCLCDNSSDDEIVIWLMKEYGAERWTKQFVICKIPSGDSYDIVCPINVFKDGDILMQVQEHSFLFCYCSKTKTIREVDIVEGNSGAGAIIHVSSFLSLKSFEMENVRSF